MAGAGKAILGLQLQLQEPLHLRKAVSQSKYTTDLCSRILKLLYAL